MSDAGAGSGLARCPAPGCPIRYRSGEDRVCADHADDADAAGFDRRKDLWGEVVAAAMTAPPGAGLS